MGFLGKVFFKYGLWAAQQPCSAIFIGICIVITCCVGFINFQSTADPQELWVPADSRAEVEQEYFAAEYGFFFRIDTAWVTPNKKEDEKVDIFSQRYLEATYWLQDAIVNDIATYNALEYTLDSFCYKPITGEGCLVESPLQYWKNDINLLYANEDVKTTAQCIPPPDNTERVCFDNIGTPVLTYAVFGGSSCEEGTSGECLACKIDASGFQMTYLLQHNVYSQKSAEEWESQVFIRNVKSFNKAFENDYHTDMSGPEEGLSYNDVLIANVRNVTETYCGAGKTSCADFIQLKADYLAERSIQDNIVQETSQNESIVIISYILMFFYVSIAIGFFPNPIHSKFGLGATGILVVIFALASSMGLTFYANQKLTMISAEVVPFLILAIGVDNMFLICRAEREIPSFVTDVEYRIAFGLKEIGPSIFTAAFCEALAFFIGMLTDQPATLNFCLVAGLGVVVDFILQMTIFVGVLALDNRRIKANRADIICCCRKYDEVKPPRAEIVRTCFQKYFVPLLYKPIMMVVILIIAALMCVIGMFSCFELQLGLNQNVSLVEGSDTFDYFETLYIYGEAGPPAYLVFKNVNYSDPANLASLINIAAELAALDDTVLPPVYTWVTPFKNFINAGGEWREECDSVKASLLDFDSAMAQFVKIEIESECCQSFGICGEQFSQDVIFDDFGTVRSTRFRFQHTTMKTQEDYIRGMLETRRACDLFSSDLTANSDSYINLHLKMPSDDQYAVQNLGIDPLEHEKEAPIDFTYSLYYVYYDQYTYIRGVLFQNVFIGIGAIIVSMQVISSLSIALIIGFCVFLVFFQLMGVMWMLNIVIGGYPVEMNAIFVVNLVTSLGFGVEFCNHIAMNFMKQEGETRQIRSQKAMNKMGSSVVVGIASTKFLGVMILAFAPSTLFRLYYFRMYLMIIFLGVFNGLFFLPVLLRICGPPVDRNEVLQHEQDMMAMKKMAGRRSGMAQAQTVRNSEDETFPIKDDDFNPKKSF